MKIISLVLIFCYLSLSILAQEGSILILPETGINNTMTNYTPKQKTTVKTPSESYGFVQKSDPIEVGTFISDANGGYASYGTLGLNSLSFTTHSQSPQVILNKLNFTGIGGTPLNALHVYGNAKITGAANTNYNVESAILRVDNDGKLISTPQSYVYSLPRSAFISTISADNNPIAESGDAGIYFTNSGLSYGLFEAPINVPIGATITGIEFYFIDNSSSDISITIVSTALGNTSEVNFITLNSDGAAPGIRSISSNNLNNGYGIVTNNGSTYQIKIYAQEVNSNKAWDGANTQIVAAKLIYTY